MFFWMLRRKKPWVQRAGRQVSHTHSRAVLAQSLSLRAEGQATAAPKPLAIRYLRRPDKTERRVRLQGRSKKNLKLQPSPHLPGVQPAASEEQGALGPSQPLQELALTLHTSGSEDCRDLAPPQRPQSTNLSSSRRRTGREKHHTFSGSKFQRLAEGWHRPRKPGVPSRPRYRAAGGQEAQSAPESPAPQSRSQAHKGPVSWRRSAGNQPGPWPAAPSQSSWRPVLCSSPRSPRGGPRRGRRALGPALPPPRRRVGVALGAAPRPGRKKAPTQRPPITISPPPPTRGIHVLHILGRLGAGGGMSGEIGLRRWGLPFNLRQPARPPETHSTRPPWQAGGRQPAREWGRSPREELSPEQPERTKPEPSNNNPLSAALPLSQVSRTTATLRWTRCKV